MDEAYLFFEGVNIQARTILNVTQLNGVLKRHINEFISISKNSAKI